MLHTEKLDALEDILVFPFATTSLHDVIRLRHQLSSCLTDAELIYLTLNIAGALNYLEVMSIAHGDIKPSNIVWLANKQSSLIFHQNHESDMSFAINKYTEKDFDEYSGRWVVSDFGTAYSQCTDQIYLSLDAESPVEDVKNSFYGTL